MKGDPAKTAAIRELYELTTAQVDKAEKEVAAGTRGADNWLLNNRKAVKRMDQLLQIMDDPAIPEGTIIQLTSEDEDSPFRVAHGRSKSARRSGRRSSEGSPCFAGGHAMSKHLSDARIAEIVSVIDGWRGKLTWQLLIDALEPRMGRYSRVALSNHTRIADAFRARKNAIGGREEGAVEGKTKEIQMLLGRIDRLKSENERLERGKPGILGAGSLAGPTTRTTAVSAKRN